MSVVRKETEKAIALTLRKKGLSYSEILKQVAVAKSTLSLWLRSVGLSRRQKQRLTEKKLMSIKRGWAKRREQRIYKTTQIKDKARAEIKRISKRELWLIGIALYWAEGSKEKSHNIGQGVVFSNSDSRMIQVFLHWLHDTLNISNENIRCEIYIHENARHRLRDVINYWSYVTHIEKTKFIYVYFKKHKISQWRKNQGNQYMGLLRLTV